MKNGGGRKGLKRKGLRGCCGRKGVGGKGGTQIGASGGVLVEVLFELLGEVLT